MTQAHDSDVELRNTIQHEIGRIAWHELARFFASGNAIAVDTALDLAEAAFQIARDNRAVVEQWMAAGRLVRVSDEQAKTWFSAQTVVSAIVLKPWVLVQPVKKA
jgi:hypothetical protein